MGNACSEEPENGIDARPPRGGPAPPGLGPPPPGIGSPPHLPPNIRVLGDVMGGFRLVLIYIAHKLKIPDFIGDGTKTVAEIAKYTETANVENVERLMYALAANGYFELKDELVFANNELSSCLRRDVPGSASAIVGATFEDAYLPWGKLPGMFGPNPISSPFDEAFPEYKGKGGPFGPGGYFESNPVQEEQFTRHMNEMPFPPDNLKSGPFEKFNRIIDVGGSKGHILILLLQIYPEKTGIVMDRPAVIEVVQKANAEKEELKEMEDRIEYFGGDFFDKDKMPVIQDGDVLMLNHILHDWSDEEAIKILKTLRAIIGDKTAGLVLGEGDMPDRDSLGPPMAHLMDMHMMTMFGGAKDRTPKQWETLLKDGGFVMDKIHPTASPLQWIEASPQ